MNIKSVGFHEIHSRRILALVKYLTVVLKRHLPLEFLVVPFPLLVLVQEIASLSESAIAVMKECPTFLGLVLGIGGVVFLELVGAVGKLALLLVGAVSIFHELLAQL